jgi:hypothetical protein
VRSRPRCIIRQAGRVAQRDGSLRQVAQIRRLCLDLLHVVAAGHMNAFVPHRSLRTGKLAGVAGKERQSRLIIKRRGDPAPTGHSTGRWRLLRTKKGPQPRRLWAQYSVVVRSNTTSLVGSPSSTCRLSLSASLARTCPRNPPDPVAPNSAIAQPDRWKPPPTG